jgi:DNA segregation ATPase FtsK/SpoIIIE-like protein
VLTFSGISDSAYLWRPVATDLKSALGILRDAISEMEKRYLMLAQEGLISLHDRFKEGRSDVPFLILVFDEFADLILTGRLKRRNLRIWLLGWPVKAEQPGFTSFWQRSGQTGRW